MIIFRESVSVIKVLLQDQVHNSIIFSKYFKLLMFIKKTFKIDLQFSEILKILNF